MAKVAIITGASSGIGRTSAIALSEKGWSVVLFARRLENLLETKAMCADPEQCLAIQGDVTSEEMVLDLFRQTISRFGRLDLLFNNAGISAPQIPIEELTLSQFEQVVNVNLVGTFLCTREAVKIFKSQTPQGGRIINNGSISAYTPRPHSTPYTSTKHAVLGMTKSTLLDGRKFNITCTQIDIGNAQTDMAGSHSDGAMQPDGRIVPEHMMDVKHVGDAVAYIAGLPHEVTVLTFNIMATRMPFVGRG
ncbi:short-chain dehydrogenase/reductase SDR [Laetiporus sulphureus 93-53]|uniref:Short-chain dehydrogenase/reductase SDR n=1 Tax=Laetiporus sulphureus 93-53 TaxID=1314785 RepID=A0A165HTE3_9APHY|nr:short-chain dehydrogenase/reductase SDR [Laetiporus sulphureus 93-53]KZT12165.1 short-chain dehydrogenase/reductase SDR [Laetiporus sulphureus 93-53]